MKNPAKTFEDLVVWQKVQPFVLAVYRLSQTFARSETYALTSQFRRAAVSIPANIAEGFRKREKADKLLFLNVAQGSLEGSRCYLMLTRDLDYGDVFNLERIWVQVSALLRAYLQAILNSESLLKNEFSSRFSNHEV